MCFLEGTGGCAWEADMRPLPGKVPAGRCHGPRGDGQPSQEKCVLGSDSETFPLPWAEHWLE